MAEKELNLLKDFPPVTTEAWMEKITTDLKGADFTKKLVWRTNEGFNVMPFYRQEDLKNLKITDSAPGKFPYVRGTKNCNHWYVRQNIEVKDAKSANAKALDILNKGIDSLGFQIDKTELSPDYIATLLNGISAEAVELNFDVCVNHATELVTLLTEYFKSKKYTLTTLNGSVNLDPINRMMLKGKKFTKEEVSSVLERTVKAAKELPGFRVIGVNAVSLNNSGAFATQELGYALAWGNQYLEMLTDAGIDIDTAAKSIEFNFGIGGNYFMEIAKFRAAKWLWAEIVNAYKPASKESTKIYIHAETSLFNTTIYDAYVNLLRTETEAMSATLAGVDSLTVNRFDIDFKKTNEFSERIARNQQLLLREESHFDKITDPSGGSYYIENLTENIAKQAWADFLELENADGFFSAVVSSKVQNDMKATAEKRLKLVSQRRENILGTNQFPNFNETAKDKIDASAKGECGCENEIEALPRVREAEEFEAMRLGIEKSGKRPKAFMLTIGNLSMRLARSQFSSNFFACSDYEIIDNLGFKTVEEGIDAALKANADVIVLCSSDDEYAEYAPAAYAYLKSKDTNKLFVVAGAPACMEDLKAKGIEYFIHVRSNVLDTLEAFNKIILK